MLRKELKEKDMQKFLSSYVLHTIFSLRYLCKHQQQYFFYVVVVQQICEFIP